MLSVSYNGGASFDLFETLEDGSDKLDHDYPTTIANSTHTLTAYSVYDAAKKPHRVGVKLAFTPMPV